MDDDIIKEYRPLKLTEKSARAFIRLDVEYHEKANKLRNEYLDKLAALYKRFKDKEASEADNPFNKTDDDIKKAAYDFYISKKAEHAKQKVNLRNKYRAYIDFFKGFSEYEIDAILELLENNFRGYVPNWANIAKTTQLLPDEIPNEEDEIPNGDEEVPNGGEEVPNGKDEIPNEDGEIPNRKDEIPNEGDEISSEDGDNETDKDSKKTKIIIMEWDMDKKIQSYSKAIREIRLKRGKSLEEMGKILGCTRQNVMKIEQDKIKTLPVEKVPTIAKAMGVSPAYLLGLAEDNYMPTRIECFFWEHPDALDFESAYDAEKFFKMWDKIIFFVRFYIEDNPVDSSRFFESNYEIIQEKLKTLIEGIDDIELLSSLERILNTGKIQYSEVASIIKAVAALCTIPDIGNSFFTSPISNALKIQFRNNSD